jgi:Tfp pilus assembly protein PilN
MPQQINLCSSILRPQRQRFGARTILPVLGATVLVVGAMAVSWVWSLEGSAVTYRQTLDTQAGEIKILQTAIERSRANTAPVDPALMQQLQQRKAAVVQREKVLEQLQQGMFRPGEGHSDRLLMVARTIPNAVWVNSVKVDAALLEVSGFTLDPEALNTWVVHLAAHPLMRNLKLASVRVDSSTMAHAILATAVPAEATSPQTSAPPPAPAHKVWAFSLTSSQEPGPTLTGGKP